VTDESKRKSIERYTRAGHSVREIAILTDVPKSTVVDVQRRFRARQAKEARQAQLGELAMREQVEVGLDDIFFAMERVKAGRDPDAVAIELGVPAAIVKNLGEAKLMIPFKSGKTLSIRLERGRDREGALARALDRASAKKYKPEPAGGLRAHEVNLIPPAPPSASQPTLKARPALKLVKG
jgi:hypothetical protein